MLRIAHVRGCPTFTTSLVQSCSASTLSKMSLNTRRLLMHLLSDITKSHVTWCQPFQRAECGCKGSLQWLSHIAKLAPSVISSSCSVSANLLRRSQLQKSVEQKAGRNTVHKCGRKEALVFSFRVEKGPVEARVSAKTLKLIRMRKHRRVVTKVCHQTYTRFLSGVYVLLNGLSISELSVQTAGTLSFQIATVFYTFMLQHFTKP